MMACRRVITEQKCNILSALYFQMSWNAVDRTQACCIDIRLLCRAYKPQHADCAASGKRTYIEGNS